MATWPTSPASTANLDAGTDRPSLARPDLKTNVDNVNAIIDMFNVTASPTNGSILKYSSSTTKFEMVADADVNTTYAISAETASGGANLRLTGSDASTDDVKIASGTGITVSRTDANTITVTSTVSSGMTSFTVAGDTGTSQTVSDANTLTISGGTNLNSVASATDVLTINLDTTITGLTSLTSTTLVTDAINGSSANGPIVISPDGTGDVHLNADSVRIGDNNADATLATRGTGDLILTTNEGAVTEGVIRIYDGANGNITLTPNGTGNLVLDGLNWPQADGTANYVLKTNGSGQLSWVAQPTSVATLSTPRAIYGNNFDGSAALTQIIASTYGGTGNGFTKFSGPTTAERTFTLPDASSTIVVQGGALGTPSSGTLTNATGLPIGTGVSGLGTGVATFLGTPTAANLATMVTDETGSGSLVFATSPTLVTPVLGTPASGNLTNTTVDGTNKVGYRTLPPVGTKTGSYTLAVGDVGEYVQVGSGGSITIPNSTFAEGDVVVIANNHTAAITITCTITDAYIAGTDADKATVSLATRGLCNILFLSGTRCIISGNVS